MRAKSIEKFNPPIVIKRGVAKDGEYPLLKLFGDSKIVLFLGPKYGVVVWSKYENNSYYGEAYNLKYVDDGWNEKAFELWRPNEWKVEFVLDYH